MGYNIKFEEFILDNGLKVILHQDFSSQLVTCNLLYNVGAKDEDPDCTGLAHLFEHLMFSGTKKIPNFDSFLESVGAQNNAFTNNDITNYYITIPPNNLEYALCAESDRMLGLAFSQNSLDVQKSVVIEEFKQNYLNQPYGDIYLLLRPLCYTVHPYKWCTIGKELSHIEKVNLNIVKDFFYSHYAPNNAILVITGNFQLIDVKQKVHKWFSKIPYREIKPRNYMSEPPSLKKKHLQVNRDVPSNCLIMAFHMSERINESFYVVNIISRILSKGFSSRLYQNLVSKERVFSEINTFPGEDFDPSLFYIKGYLCEGVSYELAEMKLRKELDILCKNPITNYELNLALKKNESTLLFSYVDNSYKAIDLAIGKLLGDVNLINKQILIYNKITPSDIMRESIKLFDCKKSSTLYYGK